MKDAQETRAVELAYVPAPEDAVAALRARMRTTPAGRLQNGILVASGLVILQALVLSFTGPRGPSLRSTVLCLSGLAVVAGVYPLVPTLQGRQVHRVYAAQGAFRAVVDDSGVRVVSRYSDTTYRWPMLTRYAETAEL